MSSITALLKNAASIREQIENFKDAQAAFDYKYSGFTDEAFATYQDRLQSRIDNLSATSSVSNASKALSLSSTLEDARKSNMSSNITRLNIQMMAGNASTSDKLALVISQAQTAQSIGDMTLYQHLEEQAYSLSQQQQKEELDAQVASATLAQVNGALSQLGMGSGSQISGSSNNADWVQQIRTAAQKYGVDPKAALAVASAEGLGGGVGDGGTSFGPFQLHIGGALPAGKDRAWAESAEGIDYAMSRIAGVAKGLTGQAAVEAIVNKFERPANPTGEVSRAMQAYGGNFTGPLTSAQAAIASGNYTISDLAQAGKEQLDQLQQGYVSAAHNLEDNLKQFNLDFAKVGKNGQQTSIDKFVKNVAPALEKLGVALPVGAKPNYGDLLGGIYKGLNKIYGNAAIAASAFNPQAAEDYTQKANSYATGEAKIPTNVKGINGGTKDMNLFDLQELAHALANPGTAVRYMQTAAGGVVEKPQAGLQYAVKQANGVAGPGVEPAYSANPYQSPQSQYRAPVDQPNAYVSAPLDLTTTLNGLHLQFRPSQNGYAQQGHTVQVTDKTADFIKKVAKPGTVLQVWMSPQGLQFEGQPSGGFSGSSVFTVTRDGSGKSALYEEGPNGSRLVGGEYGYNWLKPNNNDSKTTGSGHSSGFLGHLFDAIKGSAGNLTLASIYGNGNIGSTISAANKTAYDIQQAKIAEQNRIAAQAMLAQQAAALPTITVNNPPPPPAPIPIYRPPALAPIAINRAPAQPVAPRTFNPQPAPAPVQKPSSRPLQGGSFNLLTSGGGGIRL
jgi:hypothetical protein